IFQKKQEYDVTTGKQKKTRKYAIMKLKEKGRLKPKKKEKDPSVLKENISHNWAHLTTSLLIATLSTFPLKPNWT
uniref:Uncharacterized protein n=1 Tax=Pan troglodytes TaxID=9598 RepID=A0A2I3SPB5_PANTR